MGPGTAGLGDVGANHYSPAMRDTAGANDDLPLRERVMEARKRRQRRSIRWVGHDYAQAGFYFVTICTHGHVSLFGRVMDNVMELNAAGRAVERSWRAIPTHFPQVELDAFVVMPNHVHGILIITPSDGPMAIGAVGAYNDSPVRKAGGTPVRGPRHSPTHAAGDAPIGGDPDATVGANVGANHHSPTQGTRPRGTSNTLGSIVRGFKIGVTQWMRCNCEVRTVWHRSFYEHVIRNQRALQRIRRYIAENPANWASDRENPEGNRNQHRGGE